MAVSLNTTPSRVATEQRVVLEGVGYRIRLQWNARAATWMLDLLSETGDALATGLALRAGVPLTLHLRHRIGMPPGSFVLIDTSDSLGDPTFDDLGDRVRLIYLTSEDLEEVLV